MNNVEELVNKIKDLQKLKKFFEDELKTNEYTYMIMDYILSCNNIHKGEKYEDILKRNKLFKIIYCNTLKMFKSRNDILNNYTEEDLQWTDKLIEYLLEQKKIRNNHKDSISEAENNINKIKNELGIE